MDFANWYQHFGGQAMQQCNTSKITLGIFLLTCPGPNSDDKVTFGFRTIFSSSECQTISFFEFQEDAFERDTALLHFVRFRQWCRWWHSALFAIPPSKFDLVFVKCCSLTWYFQKWDVPSTNGITAILRNTNTGQDVYVLFDFQSSTTRQQMLYVTLSPTNFSGKHGISRGFSRCFTLKVLPSRLAIVEISFSTKLSHPYQTLLQNHINNVTVSSSGLNIAFHQWEGEPRLSNFDIDA